MKLFSIFSEEWEWLRTTRMERETNAFIHRFLTPVKTAKTETLRLFLNKYYGKDLRSIHLDQEAIRLSIRSMSYKEFLRTVYWRAVAMAVKEAAGFRCSLCGRKTRALNVHHIIYDNHGTELQNLQDLMCVCENCHKRLHKKS